jgi:putative membrane protein
MKKPVLKVISLTLCAALLVGGIGAAYALNGSQSTEAEETPAPVATAERTAASNSKNEMVYVLASADGTVDKIIVSDWIKNELAEAEVSDRSDLADLEGDMSYTMNADGMQVWDAQGDDVYYQGTIQQELPVELSVSYWLDGSPIAADALAGKSGRVTIRFDYTNCQYEYVEINGQQEKIYVPFAMVTGLVLDNDRFTNVTVSNGKVFNDGDRTAVVGMAFPGLQDNLQLDQDVLDLPDYVEISADVEDFELAMTMTVATNSVFNDMNLDDVDSLDDLEDGLDQMTDGMDELMDGAAQLYDGLGTLKEGSQSISDGVTQLASGLNKLTANNSALTGGAQQVFNSLLSLANQQLAAAGVDAPTLTTSNYSAVLSEVLNSLDENSVIATAQAQVEEAVRAQSDTVRAGVTAAVEQEVAAQVQAAVQPNVKEQVEEAVRAQVESQVLASLGLTAGSVPAEVQPQVDAAVTQQMASAEVQALIASNLEAQMASEDVQAVITAQTAQQMASESVQALIDSKTEEQIQLLIQQNMASDEVQAKITEGLSQVSEGAAQIQSLKTQLDSYNTFYQGLVSYTDGVAQAAAGADQLEQAMPEFLEGVDALEDGALQLSDGLKEFNEEGVQKLSDAYHGDLEGLMDRLRATSDVSKSYQSFAGLGDDMDGEVKFVYKTEGIQVGE